MQELKALLKQGVGEKLSNDQKELAGRLIDAACAALDGGGDDEAIRHAVVAEVNSTLEEAKSSLADAEKIMTGG